MRIGRRIWWIALPLWASAITACQNADMLAPGGRAALSDAEAAAISEYLTQRAFEGWDFGQVGDVGGAALLAGSTLSIDHTVDALAPCPFGGALGVSGAISGSIDDQAFSGNLDLDLTTAARACAIEHQGIGLTLDTGPDLRLDGTFAFDQTGLVGEATFTYTGVVSWAADDGRSGKCVYDVLVTVTSQGSLAQSGAVCGISL